MDKGNSRCGMTVNTTEFWILITNLKGNRSEHKCQ